MNECVLKYVYLNIHKEKKHVQMNTRKCLLEAPSFFFHFTPQIHIINYVGGGYFVKYRKKRKPLHIELDEEIHIEKPYYANFCGMRP